MKYMFFIFFETKRLIKHDIARGKPSRWLKRDFPIVLAIPNQKCFEFPHKALARSHCCRHKCFPVFPRAQHLLPTQILCPGHKKCFWFCPETFCVRNKCFPVCAAWKHKIYFVSRAFARLRNIMGNNVSATMCPRLRGSIRWLWAVKLSGPVRKLETQYARLKMNIVKRTIYPVLNVPLQCTYFPIYQLPCSSGCNFKKN